MVQVRRLDDLGRARRLHRRAFPEDFFPDSGDAFWEAMIANKTVGFCSAVCGGRRELFLSRTGVFAGYHSKGLHRHMIETRMEWGVAEGMDVAVTYTTNDNFPSIANLLRAGFRFYRPRGEPWFIDGPPKFERFLYFRKDL